MPEMAGFLHWFFAFMNFREQKVGREQNVGTGSLYSQTEAKLSHENKCDV